MEGGKGARGCVCVWVCVGVDGRQKLLKINIGRILQYVRESKEEEEEEKVQTMVPVGICNSGTYC